jgi:hypothetical protein
MDEVFQCHGIESRLSNITDWHYGLTISIYL